MRWRATRDPYRILVSEVMLQQTQVERVKEKYSLFIEQFPDVHALARAPLSEVLRLWSGLGYNRRAKYLRDCAREIIERFDGKFPRGRKELLGLPGVGPSTASAIRSFAFGEDDPMIDTNIRRILSRVFYSAVSRRRKAPRDADLYALARMLIPKGGGREWNYAMLDLAATTCTARNHRDDCPFTDWHGKISDTKRPSKVIPFVSTRRYARGRALAAISTQGGATLADVRRAISPSTFSASEILRGLVNDGLIRVKGKRYVLSDM